MPRAEAALNLPASLNINPLPLFRLTETIDRLATERLTETIDRLATERLTETIDRLAILNV